MTAPMRSSPVRLWLTLLTSAACLLAVPASATGALIGPRAIGDGAYTGAFAVNECTYSTVQLPSAKVRSPFTGKITRWRVHVPAPFSIYVNDGPLRLQILKRTLNHPGVVNDEFAVVRETADQTVTPIGAQAFNADLRIRKGQFIGMTGAADTTIASGTQAGAYHLQWCPGLAPGGPGAHSNFAVEQEYLLFNATVKR